tara:strand:+ start:1622 stop:2248 length:627 start_codon:yes stop_codon:yes gene_type:complete
LGASHIKVVSLGVEGGIAKGVVEDLESMGASCTWMDVARSDFDRTVVDWRSALSGAHWLILEMSSFGKEESLASTVGAAMIFAELEGAKTALIVDDKSMVDYEKAWGSVVDRIRQIGFISMSVGGLAKIASMEQVDHSEVGELLRLRGLVSVVAIMDEQSRLMEIHHNLGTETGSTTIDDLKSMTASMLAGLPSSKYSSEGVRSSAGI